MRRTLILVSLAGLCIGAGAAVGKIPAQQMQRVALGALWFVLAHWFVVLSWILTIIFAALYYRWKRSAIEWYRHSSNLVALQQQLDEQRAAEQQRVATTRRHTSSTRKRVTQ